MRFEGTAGYIAGEELRASVNVAVTLERPLLVRGEPGTGKTLLAEAVAEGLGTGLYSPLTLPPDLPMSCARRS